MKSFTRHHKCSEDVAHHHSSCSKYVEHPHKQHARVPKGCVAVYVLPQEAQKDEQEHEQHLHRCIVPLRYLSHPEFGELLRRAEEEFGFRQQAGLSLPCSLTEFQAKLQKIQEDHSSAHHHHNYKLCPVQPSPPPSTSHHALFPTARCVPPIGLVGICHTPSSLARSGNSGANKIKV